MIRILDISISIIGLLIFLPVFLLISILIVIESKGPILFIQSRVGKNGVEFKLFKFRTMRTGSDQQGLLTIGEKDPRITKLGLFLRKYKLDEFPQLLNVLKGDMSLVGPRPEVRKYVNLYSEDQLKVLLVRPGITDLASIQYSDENETLKQFNDPEKAYIETVMVDKIKLNMYYLNNYNLKNYFKIIFLTLKKVLKV